MIKSRYLIFRPSCKGIFVRQWQSCFDDLQSFLSDHPEEKVFVVRVFVASENKQEFLQRSGEIKQSFSGTGIPYSLLSESPEKPNFVIIEAGFINSLDVEVQYSQVETIKFCKLSKSGYSEYWFAGIESNCSESSISESAEIAYSLLKAAFLQLGLGYNHIIRQWNYVERIYGFEQIEPQPRQKYQLFNEVRGEYYSRYRTVPYFPAATGIGVDCQGVILECLAVTGDENLKIIALSNPKQHNSYNYCQTVLKGSPLTGKTSNQPPLFERAILITNGQSSRIFISGTASIVGQETIGLNDVKKQTRVTIDNIEMLTSKSNLRSHYPELAVFPDKYTYVRVYVKNEEDIPTVKRICLEHFGEVSMGFLKADICREDLLVEIEAEKTN
jgi:enamine deaminase RidA (YjgF/YER057c/UK114 family)